MSQPRTLSAPLPNPSLQVTADHKLKQVDAPVLAPLPGEVLLHVKASGICGSDVHFWKTGRIGSLVFEGDCIIGHEAAGVVLKCGEGVTCLKPGDRVAIEPGVSCGKCFLCMDGRYNLCDDVKFAGVYPYAGSLRRYMTHPARWLHKMPDSMSFGQGALVEPLSVVLHGIESSGGLTLGRPLLVCGAGPIGLIAVAAARASGAHPIVVTDVDGSRLAFAAKFAPYCTTYQIEAAKSSEQNAAGIRKVFGDDEYSAPRKVLECTGVESSICTAGYVARRGGLVMVIGVGRPVIHNIPFMHMSLAEIDLRFINRYKDTWPRGISLLSSGIIDLAPLVTHVFPLEDAKKALETSSDLKNGGIKIHIVDEVDSTRATPRND